MKRKQAQISVTEQLRKLVSIANAHGLYDAADYIEGVLRDVAMRRAQLEAIAGGEK